MFFSQSDLDEILERIAPTDRTALSESRRRLGELAKPPGSLGALEDIAARLAAITGKVRNKMERRLVIIMCADNGVVEENIASTPQVVTLLQSINSVRGLTGVAALAKRFGADITVIDVGINSDVVYPEIVDRKIRKSTGNITKEPAMTPTEMLQAIRVGIEAVKNARDAGYDIVGAGELGIGNTTTSSAVLCAMLGMYTEEEIESITGRGAGLTDESYARKLCAIHRALKLHGRNGTLEDLRMLGGLDIAAMTGVYIGAAYYRIPVVIDGFISAVAALCAARLNPLCAEYMFASHQSFERGYVLAANELGLEAPLKLGMRLGEGSGCPLMFAVIDAACAIMNDMGTFDECRIDKTYLDSIRNEDAF